LRSAPLAATGGGIGHCEDHEHRRVSTPPRVRGVLPARGD
jgi:hypothetical protein